MKRIALIFLLALTPLQAFAYPEMVRHGYGNCTACHTSPTGGGLMSAYGRELSREVLSTWGKEGEQRVLHGWLEDDKWATVSLGGAARVIQTYRDTSFVRQANFFLMQAELEVGLKFGALSLAGTAGRIQDRNTSTFGSHRYWAAYSFSDELSARAGLFYPAFGINLPEHFTQVRRGMGFDEGMETHNVEVSWIGETWSGYLTAAFAPSTAVTSAQGRSSALMGQVSRSIGTSSRVGVSALSGTGSQRAVGAYALAGFTSKLFLLAEMDLKWSDASAQALMYRYAKLGYEPVQGLVVFGMHDGSSTRDGWGGGVQWFPRPHFELEMVGEKILSGVAAPGGDTFAWLMLHYYL